MKVIKVTYMGEQMSLRKLAQITGINLKTIKWRYSEQYRGEDLWRKPDPSQQRVRAVIEVRPRKQAEQAKREKARAELERVKMLPLGAMT